MDLIKKCGFKLPDFAEINNSSSMIDLTSVTIDDNTSADFILDNANALLGLAQAFDEKTDEFNHYDHMFSHKKDTKVHKDYISSMKDKLKEIDTYNQD